MAEAAEHGEIVAGAAADLENLRIGGRLRFALDQVGDDPAARPIPPMTVVELGHLLVNDALHQRKTQLAIEGEGRQRRHEDRRDQRPPGRAVQRAGEEPGEGSLRKKPDQLDEEELDLQPMVLSRAVAAEAPTAVEDEANADARPGMRSPRPRPASSRRSRGTSRSPSKHRRSEEPTMAKRTSWRETVAVEEEFNLVAMPPAACRLKSIGYSPKHGGRQGRGNGTTSPRTHRSPVEADRLFSFGSAFAAGNFLRTGRRSAGSGSATPTTTCGSCRSAGCCMDRVGSTFASTG